MEQVGEESASRKVASANRRSADAYALAFLPTVQKLMAAGFVSHRGLANELNRRGIPAAGGGRWHRTTVLRMLRRLDLLTSGHDGIDNGLTSKRVADVRAEALRPTIRKLRKAGFVSISAIARELNKRGIPTPRGGKWHMTMVTDSWSVSTGSIVSRSADVAARAVFPSLRLVGG
jgi:Recombinase